MKKVILKSVMKKVGVWLAVEYNSKCDVDNFTSILITNLIIFIEQRYVWILGARVAIGSLPAGIERFRDAGAANGDHAATEKIPCCRIYSGECFPAEL